MSDENEIEAEMKTVLLVWSIVPEQVYLYRLELDDTIGGCNGTDYQKVVSCHGFYLNTCLGELRELGATSPERTRQHLEFLSELLINIEPISKGRVGEVVRDIKETDAIVCSGFFL